jgi:hypothetical protein
MLDALGRQQLADLDGAGRGEAAIGIDQKRCLRAQRPAHRRHDGLGAARPFIDVMAILRRDPEFEGIEAGRSRSWTKRAASASGVMSRRMEEA